MKQSDLPARFDIPFADGAGPSYIRSIPKDHQAATTTDAPASLHDGFPPETFLPVASGGIPPAGADFNGLFNQITAALRWHAAGGLAVYNGGFSSEIGGYPKGAMLASATTAGVIWVSLADDNTTDPDSLSAANWTKQGAAIYSTDIGGNWKRVAPDGWVEMGGILSPVRDTEGPFSMTFPFGGFDSQCLGVFAIVRNTASSKDGSAMIQEVSLTKTVANLYMQSHQNSPNAIGGGIRWRAWGF
ncbi:hypothetical protein [Novosphingobium colocasiae]|uniref:gp53-like domain-containing protein n=1 Tax=Novosphingobium colocasiae TaxID=1256513 RepID=UPI0035B4F015